jgi:hypothetical protein
MAEVVEEQSAIYTFLIDAPKVTNCVYISGSDSAASKVHARRPSLMGCPFKKYTFRVKHAALETGVPHVRYWGDNNGG